MGGCALESVDAVLVGGVRPQAPVACEQSLAVSSATVVRTGVRKARGRCCSFLVRPQAGGGVRSLPVACEPRAARGATGNGRSHWRAKGRAREVRRVRSCAWLFEAEVFHRFAAVAEFHECIDADVEMLVDELLGDRAVALGGLDAFGVHGVVAHQQQCAFGD